MTSIDGEMLSPKHEAELEASAIDPAIIAERGYETITNPKALPPQFTHGQRERHGLLIPIRDVTGDIVTHQLKPDTPRVDANGKPIKYETAANGRMCIDVPIRVQRYLRDKECPLWITEGCKKVDSGLSHGISCIIGLTGVWNWMSGKNALPDWREITLTDREVILAFDSDGMRKDSVRRALEELRAYLVMQGARVRFLLMPDLPDGTKRGLDDWFASGRTMPDLEQHITDTLPSSVHDWEPPIPLDDSFGPDFDTDLLPGAIGEYVAAVAVSTQTPPGMAAVMTLGTISAAARGRYEVFVPEHHWSEPVLGQFVVFALPGERKSAVVQETTQPLILWERAKRIESEDEAHEWASQLRVLQKQLEVAEGAQSKPAKLKDDNPGDPDLLRQSAAKEVADHLRKAVYPLRIVADDITPEKAKEMIVQQRGALAIISAEGTFFAILAGRYADSPSLEIMLNGHNAEPITVDRKSGVALYTPRGCLTIAVACQPDVAATMGMVDGFRARGGAARVLPAFVRSYVGTRSI